MATELKGVVRFGAVSIINQSSLGFVGMSAIGQAGFPGWSLSNLSAATGTTTLSASESTAANIAAALATLVSQLARKGIIGATGTGF